MPPSAILILDEEKNILKNGTVLGPLKEGQQLSLECETRGARPAPTVGWYRSGKRLTGEAPREEKLQNEGRAITRAQTLICITDSLG